MTFPPSQAPADDPRRPHLHAVGLAGFSPANFGMVMATGIVSIAAHLLGWSRLAQALLWLNTGLYVVLWILTVWRVLRYPARCRIDLENHSRGPGFFTTVAGTGVLGSQFVVLSDNYAIALVLWFATALLWFACTYGILALLTIKSPKPTLERGINGTWLLMVVATQSLAVLGTQIGMQADPAQAIKWHFAALALWLWGGMLYIWIMALIFYRYTFFRLTAGDLTPPYWINMGAMAISTLAGTLIISAAPSAPFLQALIPFIKGFTLFYWASGTWWIPMLLVLGVWVFGLQRQPLRYSPMYWGAVFPLGMYATCTSELVRTLDLPFLGWLPPTFGVAAIIAWALAFAGLLHRVLLELRALKLKEAGGARHSR